MIFMSASIFMTVAIAMERYVAVHYPIDYNQVITNRLKTQLYYFLKIQFTTATILKRTDLAKTFKKLLNRV